MSLSKKPSNLANIFLVKSFERTYPSCFLSTDSLHLPTTNTSLPLSFPQCRPSKYSTHTLGPSGSLLGLAPSEHLSQTGSTSPLKQLLDKGAIQRPIFSLMLINGQDGVLSAGGNAAKAIERVVSQTEAELKSLGDAEKESVAAVPADKAKGLAPLVKRGRHKHEIISRQEDWEEGWAWTDVQGAEGWWQLLMRGVWVDGSKVLNNQAVVIDVGVFHWLSCCINGSRYLHPNISTDQQPLHPRPTPRGQSLLRLRLRLSSSTTTVLQLLRLSLPQPTRSPFRIWWNKFPIHARGPRC